KNSKFQCTAPPVTDEASTCLGMPSSMRPLLPVRYVVWNKCRCEGTGFTVQFTSCFQKYTVLPCMSRLSTR
uniref:Secreted protein n=1 Tax=Haemonchus contortus TaxID=6289 RepID=A0A7I4Z543_HAECO